MKEAILTRISKLIDVKSIVTIILTVLFCILSYQRIISGEQVLTVFTIVIGFYFGTQARKGESNEKQ